MSGKVDTAPTGEIYNRFAVYRSEHETIKDSRRKKGPVTGVETPEIDN